MEASLDATFAALSDPTRRSMLMRLSRGPATVNELAEPFGITVQAVSRHIHVLEEAGLVTRTRDAQRRPVHLNPGALEELTAWIDGYRLAHERSFRALDAVLAGIQSPDQKPGRQPDRPRPKANHDQDHQEQREHAEEGETS
jgi:DNA-binding transcriptional ArsR family regulator